MFQYTILRRETAMICAIHALTVTRKATPIDAFQKVYKFLVTLLNGL